MINEKQIEQIIEKCNDCDEWGFSKLEINWHDHQIKKIIVTKVELPVNK